MLNNLTGLDHLVVLVRDLDEAASTWARLGFTLSPRGLHSPHLGTGNHTIMLGPDYLELLGVVTETPYNAPSRALLAEREGIERAAFRTHDAAALADELRARGLEPNGPLDFGRPVDLPGGGQAEARFRTVHWPLDRRPGGMRIFACEHLTPQAVWIPELQSHLNTAERIDRVEVLAANARSAADDMADLIGGKVETQADGGFRVSAGPETAFVSFLDRRVFAGRHPGIAQTELPEEGAVTIALRVADLATAARAMGRPVTAPGRIEVPPSSANGVLLEFLQA